MKTCLLIEIVDFTKLCEENIDNARHAQEFLFGEEEGLVVSMCVDKSVPSTAPGNAHLYLFDKPLCAVHCAIDLLSDIRKHNAKDINKEFLVHIALTYGEVFEASEGVWTGACIDNAFSIMKDALPNYILVDHMVYLNLKNQPIDFRLVTPDNGAPQEYPDAIYSIRTNEVINGRLSRRIDELGIKINSLSEKINI